MNVLATSHDEKKPAPPPPDYYDEYLEEATGFSSEDEFDDIAGPPSHASSAPSRKYEICK